MKKIILLILFVMLASVADARRKPRKQHDKGRWRAHLYPGKYKGKCPTYGTHPKKIKLSKKRKTK